MYVNTDVRVRVRELSANHGEGLDADITRQAVNSAIEVESAINTMKRCSRRGRTGNQHDEALFSTAPSTQDAFGALLGIRGPWSCFAAAPRSSLRSPL